MGVKTAVLFPGQGSQCVGMAKAFYDAGGPARGLLERVNPALGRDLLGLMFDGPEEALKDTVNTQPVLYAAGLAAWAELRAAGLEAAAFAGHSLGEYAALEAAGVFGFEEGLRLVQARAEAFAEAGRTAPGAMAAVLKLDDAVVEELCREASAAGPVAPANYNAPGQVVVSGSPEGVAKVAELCRPKGGRCLPLAVSGAFHSPAMVPAGERLRLAFPKLVWGPPRVPVPANVDAQPHGAPESIQAKLVAQASSPVRWTRTVLALQAMGIERYVEAGPGRVLAGLVQKVIPQARAASVGDPETLAAFLREA